MKDLKEKVLTEEELKKFAEECEKELNIIDSNISLHESTLEKTKRGFENEKI